MFDLVDLRTAEQGIPAGNQRIIYQVDTRPGGQFKAAQSAWGSGAGAAGTRKFFYR